LKRVTVSFAQVCIFVTQLRNTAKFQKRVRIPLGFGGLGELRVPWVDWPCLAYLLIEQSRRPVAMTKRLEKIREHPAISTQRGSDLFIENYGCESPNAM
jgi:hypothetical protein